MRKPVQESGFFIILNEIKRQQTIEIMPTANNEHRHITYHVHIDGVGGWLMVLAQMPTAAWYGLSVAAGVVGAIVICALLAITAIVSQLLVAVVVVAVAFIFGVVALGLMKG